MWRYFLLLAVTTLTSSCTYSEKKADQKRVVKQAVAQTEVAEHASHFSFISKPHRVTNLSFRVGGPIKQFNAYPGNHFKQGSVIAQIDPRDFIIQKEQSEAIYLQAKAEYERIQLLFEKKNLSASTYEKARSEFISAKSRYETAQNELADTKLVAPFNGYIEQLFIEQHQEAKATQTILSFVDIDQIKIELYVNQEIALKAKSIHEIRLFFDADPQKQFQAKVIDVSKSTTSNNLSYLLTALLPNQSNSMLPGMSGKVYFSSESNEALITVPQTALMHRPTEGDYVWVIEPATGAVKKRSVERGKLLPNGNIALHKGIQAGERVATSGLRFLSDGMHVTIE